MKAAVSYHGLEIPPKSFDGRIPKFVEDFKRTYRIQEQFGDPTAQYEFLLIQKRKIFDYEKRLWYEVLVLALRDYKQFFRDSEHDFVEVFNWFFNSDIEIGSFHYICDILDFHEESILRSLIRWTKNNTEKGEPLIE